MLHQKSFFVDTNILLDNPNCLDILRNGEDNDVYIPYNVLIELDKLKNRQNLKHLVNKVIDKLLEDYDKINFLPPRTTRDLNFDHKILNELHNYSDNKNNEKIFVTNDKLLRLFSKIHGIQCEPFKESIPFQSESEIYTGILSEDDDKCDIPNHFRFVEGSPIFFKGDPPYPKSISDHNKIWKVEPRNLHQTLAFELLLDDDINLVSMQSSAGYGKTYLSLASAFYKVLQESTYHKVYVIKPTIEIGEKLGFLPGDINDKISPFFKPIDDLVMKLNDLRPAKIFLDDKNEYNRKKFEILPINYMRGMNIDDGYVIIDEVQNISRNDLRTILTRMGQNVKCVALGDTNQVDNPHLNQQNNGLNWMVKLFKGQKYYSHLVLRGKKSRGPITDMCLNVGL